MAYFGIIPESIDPTSDVLRVYALENIRSALAKVVGSDTSALIFIRLGQILKEKGCRVASDVRQGNIERLAIL